MSLARLAATEDDVRDKLAIEAFIDSVPWKYGVEIQNKRIETVEEALKEVKLLQMTEEEGMKRNSSILVNKEESRGEARAMEPRREPQMEQHMEL